MLPHGSLVVELQNVIKLKLPPTVHILQSSPPTYKWTGLLIALHKMASCAEEPPRFAGGRSGADGSTRFPANSAWDEKWIVKYLG